MLRYSDGATQLTDTHKCRTDSVFFELGRLGCRTNFLTPDTVDLLRHTLNEWL